MGELIVDFWWIWVLLILFAGDQGSTKKERT